MDFIDLIPSMLIMLGLISLLIIAHEYGHFWVARKCGVKVERFGFGLPFGPTLWSKKIGDVEYCIHLLLLGGYVAFPDDSPDSDVPADSKERFENQSVLNRAYIAIAGVTVNAIMAWVIMAFVIGFWGIPDDRKAHVAIKQIMVSDGPAAKAGLQPGDLIMGVDGKPLDYKKRVDERWADISNSIYCHANKPLKLDVRRDGQPLDITVTPNEKGKVGIMFGLLRHFEKVDSPVVIATESFTFLSDFVYKNFEAIGNLFKKFDSQQLGGPIRIVYEGAKMEHIGGFQESLILAAAISIILAVMNLLPIPALDGGHLLFLAIEAIKGSPVKKEIQEKVMQGGFLVLMSMMVFVFFNDINNMFLGGGQPSKEPPKAPPPIKCPVYPTS